MEDMLYVIHKDGYRGNCHTILYNNFCPYSKKTKEDYEAEGYRVVTLNELIPIENNYLDELCGDWIEISEERYEEQMNVLPPAKYTNGGFFVPEAYTHDVYGFYQEWNGKFYTSCQRIGTSRERILMSLEVFIHNKNGGINQ